jgi:hypothetical protein
LYKFYLVGGYFLAGQQAGWGQAALTSWQDRQYTFPILTMEIPEMTSDTETEAEASEVVIFWLKRKRLE